MRLPLLKCPTHPADQGTVSRPSGSRRALLAAGVAAPAALATQGVLTPAVAAGRSLRVNPYRATKVPSPQQRHLMNRMGCGYSRGTFAQLRSAGSGAAWFAQQLAPETIAESAKARAIPGWFPDLTHSAQDKWWNNTHDVKGGWEYAADLAGYSMMRRIYSRRQVLETMVDFWSNHLHVNANHDLAWVHRASYDDLLRRRALGRFDDLLVETSLHPAMLLYLDNWRSARNAPNENHGRELLELHTVGRTAGYTEQMVKDSATILSGHTVDAFAGWGAFYDSGRHTTGPVRVLGFSAPNAAADGASLTRDYLRSLAQQPATARTIATKLARYFVADSPSTALVDHLAGVFTRSGTDIAATLRALVAHPDFRASRGQLVRTPIEDFVATCRVLGVTAVRPTEEASFARAAIWLPRTSLLYQWPRPDGSPVGSAAWASASRMLSSFQMHWALSGGWWPRQDVRYRSASSWLPRKRLRFDRYVDHLCRLVLGKPSTPRILAAAVAAVGYPPQTVVTKDHQLAGWLVVRLTGVLLDSPDHMRR